MKNLIILSSLILIGCTSKRPASIQSIVTLPFVEVYLHTVHFTGENLPMISEWYTGKYTEWKNIKTYNGHIHKFILPKNSVIRIPKSLMIQFSPMPEEFFKAKRKIYTTHNQSISTSSKKIRSTQPQSTLPQITPSPDIEIIPELSEFNQQEQEPQKSEEEDYLFHDELIKNLLSEDQR